MISAYVATQDWKGIWLYTCRHVANDFIRSAALWHRAYDRDLLQVVKACVKPPIRPVSRPANPAHLIFAERENRVLSAPLFGVGGAIGLRL